MKKLILVFVCLFAASAMAQTVAPVAPVKKAEPTKVVAPVKKVVVKKTVTPVVAPKVEKK